MLQKSPKYHFFIRKLFSGLIVLLLSICFCDYGGMLEKDRSLNGNLNFFNVYDMKKQKCFKNRQIVLWFWGNVGKRPQPHSKFSELTAKVQSILTAKVLSKLPTESSLNFQGTRWNFLKGSEGSWKILNRSESSWKLCTHDSLAWP